MARQIGSSSGTPARSSGPMVSKETSSLFISPPPCFCGKLAIHLRPHLAPGAPYIQTGQSALCIMYMATPALSLFGYWSGTPSSHKGPMISKWAPLAVDLGAPASTRSPIISWSGVHLSSEGPMPLKGPVIVLIWCPSSLRVPLLGWNLRSSVGSQNPFLVSAEWDPAGLLPVGVRNR